MLYELLPSNTPVRRRPFLVAGLVSVSLFSATSCVQSADAVQSDTVAASVVGQKADSGTVITNFDTPFLFTYLAWDKRVKAENGHALIQGEGVTPKGGGGANIELDLTAVANQCPVIRVKVGPKNTLKTLKLMLSDDTLGLEDSKKRTATFEFPLPDKPTADYILIYPRSGATLTQPNAMGAAGTVDPAKLRQWQLLGDWGGEGAVDLDVDSVVVAEPNAEAKAVQADAIKQEEEQKAQIVRDRAVLREKYGKRNVNSPKVIEVYRVAPDIVAIAIQAGQVVPGHYGPYVEQPGDTRRADNGSFILQRKGQDIGWLIGNKITDKKDGVVYYESLNGDPLLDEPAENLATYSLVSADGSQTIKPVSVWRKSKPNDQAQPSRDFAMWHIVYLKLATPLISNTSYTVKFADGLNVQTGMAKLSTDATAVRSEAVHAFQIGYRPDDPIKHAFLSVWLGTGGAYEYAQLPTFRVLDASGKAVVSGTAELVKGKDATDKMWLGKEANYQKTAVYRLDFSTLTAPGTYRVVVDDVGASYPFAIRNDTWRKAFVTQMRGLFNQRSGVELGPPYTTFKKPRDFYPGGDVNVYETTYNVVDGGKSEAGAELEKGNTHKPVPEAWGGYHDAGDWNPRRVTHMRVTMAHLELLEMFPQYFATMKLNIPAKSGVPDVLTEALFELDLFRRLQKPDGGVPFEIETNGDPNGGELSWKQTMDAYVTAPDAWASWYYAGVAARAARLLEKYDPKTAAVYRTSAVKAMEWGERDYAKRKTNGTVSKINWEMIDARNYASILVYNLTGDKKWHDVFLENTILTQEKTNLFQWGTAVQNNAAFEYTLLPASRKSDPTLKAHAIEGLKGQAEASLNYAKGNAFRLTTPDAGKPMFIGFWSTPDAIELCRAHHATGDKRYLAGAVQACVFAGGGNPNNITYTTGVGANPIKHPFHIDSRATGQSPPEGITAYGNFDFPNWPDQQWALWPMQYFLGQKCIPNAYEWPVPEAYFDMYMYPATNEFTVDAWAPNVYVWGYLAARK